MVTCQDEKSQIKNKEKAFKVLRSRLYDLKMQEQNKEIADQRESQVGSGDRSERIRTYNFPQGRVSDHRIGMTIYKLDNFLDGDLDEIIDGHHQRPGRKDEEFLRDLSRFAKANRWKVLSQDCPKRSEAAIYGERPATFAIAHSFAFGYAVRFANRLADGSPGKKAFFPRERAICRENATAGAVSHHGLKFCGFLPWALSAKIRDFGTSLQPKRVGATKERYPDLRKQIDGNRPSVRGTGLQPAGIAGIYKSGESI